MSLFCPVCGKNIETASDLIQGLCVNCFLATYSPISMENLNLKLCPICLSYQAKGAWIKSSEDGFLEAVKEAIKTVIPSKIKAPGDVKSIKLIPKPTEIVEKSKNRLLVPTVLILKFSPNFENREFIIQKNIEVLITLETCDRCRTAKREGYNSIIQIRAKDRRLSEEEKTKILNSTRDFLEDLSEDHRFAFISKSKETKTGIDLYFADHKTAKKVASHIKSAFGALTRESHKLMGRSRDGKDVYRDVISIRLPSFSVGDVILINDKLYQILSFRNNKVACKNIRTGASETFKLISIWDSSLIAKKQDLKEYLIISIQKDTIQVMDLENYKIFELKKPPYEIKTGQKVSGLEYNDELYIIVTSE
ncbi:MAG: 60S ribosomal export protein NMD3 [Candidatus Odinarchaeia archaeon]